MSSTMLTPSHVRWSLASLLPAALCAGVLAAVPVETAAATEPHSVAPSCPAKKPPSTLPAPFAAEGKLLARGAKSLRLCRYEPRRSGALRLAGAASIARDARIAKIAAELDALPRMPPGAFACPIDRGASILLIARFPAGQVSDVVVGLEGCRVVTNGVTRRWAEPARGKRLIGQLEALTRRRAPQSSSARSGVTACGRPSCE